MSARHPQSATGHGTHGAYSIAFDLRLFFSLPTAIVSMSISETE